MLSQDDIQKTEMVLRILYQETNDSFSLFDNDYKHLAFLIANFQAKGKGFSLILNNYALYLSDKGEKQIIEDKLKKLKQISNEKLLTCEKIQEFNKIRYGIYKLLDSLEESIKNNLVLCSELLDSIPQKLFNDSIHFRKSYDDEMEILSQIKKQYISSAYNYFEKWYDFSNHITFKTFTTKKVFHTLFQSTMVYIDYSLNTKFTHNTTIPRLEHILLPYSSILNPKNLSFISHEINFYLFRNFKNHLNKPIRDSIECIYRSISNLVLRLDFIPSEENVDDYTSMIVDKMLVDYITISTAGPNYIITLFNLLSKKFAHHDFALLRAPDVLRAFFIINISRKLIFEKPAFSSALIKSTNSINSIYLDYLEKMEHYLECSVKKLYCGVENFSGELTAIYKTISEKMVKIISNELSVKVNPCIKPIPWIISDKLYEKDISIKRFFGSIVDNNKKKMDECFPASYFLYNPEAVKEKSSEDNSEESTQPSIRNSGSLVTPELLWSIGLKSYLASKEGTTLDFPQNRTARMLSCSFRIAILTLFSPLLCIELNSSDNKLPFLSICKPNLWVFVNINWKNLHRKFFKSNPSNSSLTKFEDEFKSLISGVNNDSKSTQKGINQDSNNISSMNDLYFTLGENDYFFSLNNTLTRKKIEKWPIWKKNITFNEAIKASYFNFNPNRVDPHYTYSSIVAERFFSNNESKKDKNKLKVVLLGSFKRDWCFGEVKINPSLENTLTKAFKSIFKLSIDRPLKKCAKKIVSSFNSINSSLSAKCMSLKDLNNKDNIKDDFAIKEISHIVSKLEDYNKKEYDGQVFKLIDFIRSLMLKSQNQESLISIDIINILEVVNETIKELLSLVNVVMLVNLIDFLTRNGKLFDLYLTNSWSDIGLIIHDFKDTDVMLLDDLYRNFFYYSQTHILSNVKADLNTSNDQSSADNKFNVLLQTSSNSFDPALKACFPASNDNETSNTLGFFDYNVPFSAKSIKDTIAQIRNVAEGIVNKNDACDIKDIMTSMHYKLKR